MHATPEGLVSGQTITPSSHVAPGGDTDRGAAPAQNTLQKADCTGWGNNYPAALGIALVTWWWANLIPWLRKFLGDRTIQVFIIEGIFLCSNILKIHALCVIRDTGFPMIHWPLLIISICLAAMAGSMDLYLALLHKDDQEWVGRCIVEPLLKICLSCNIALVYRTYLFHGQQVEPKALISVVIVEVIEASFAVVWYLVWISYPSDHESTVV